MNAQEEIDQLLEQWLTLTRTEARAIEAGAWSEVEEIQARKSDLQPALNAARERWTNENPAVSADGEHPFRAAINRLIGMEASNGALIAAQRRQAEVRREALKKTARTLRQVHRSYRQMAEPAWQSYS